MGSEQRVDSVQKRCWLCWVLLALELCNRAGAADPVRELQTRAVTEGQSPVGYWGTDPEMYTQWGTHSNRLIPVYTFGTALASQGQRLRDYVGEQSVYRDAARLELLYGELPAGTHDATAVWCDQTDIYRLQRAALDAGRKYIFLVVFDGMDWQTTQAAAVVAQGKVLYREGRGTGLHFLDYTAHETTEYGWMCTSPWSEGATVDVNTQTVTGAGAAVRGGFDPLRGGRTPWDVAPEKGYLLGKALEGLPKHFYTDSSSSATSMTAGIKTYNNAVNVDAEGRQVETIAQLAQRCGYRVGAISSVPLSHATPAAAYAHNVERDDYQDLARDMLGLPSVSHPEQPLPGMEVVIGGGYGTEKPKQAEQGENFEAGTIFVAPSDLKRADARYGGKYHVAVRTPGVRGKDGLLQAAEAAADQGRRLLGVFGVAKYNSHLPFATADGDYQPAIGRQKKAEVYTDEDVRENPTLAEMTRAALVVLQAAPQGFWLMVEAGDVDWANHDNNLDNSIGAVFSGDAAVRVITDWVEAHSNWQESLLIVTADHGHYLHLVRPELLLSLSEADRSR